MFQMECSILFFEKYGGPLIGMEFDSDEAAKEYYVAYANHIGFDVWMSKSH